MHRTARFLALPLTLGLVLSMPLVGCGTSGEGSNNSGTGGGAGGSQSGGSGGSQSGGSGGSQSGGSGGSQSSGSGGSQSGGSGGSQSGGSGGGQSGGSGGGRSGGTGGTVVGGTGGTTASGGAGGTVVGGSGGTVVGGSGGTTASGGTGGGVGGTGGTAGSTGTGGGTAPTCDESSIGTSPSTLGVDVTTAQYVVHKEIFGLLMETLGNDVTNGLWVGKTSSIPNTNGVRNDIIEGMKEAGVGAIEWPGGCAANNYNWETNKNPSNTLGVDGFMDFVTTVGAEPVLVGRPKPEYAASNQKWVDYVNNNPSHPEWKLKYFKIGNEVWGCGGNLDKDEATYETWYNANYDLLKTPINGKELFLVAGTALIGNNGWLDSMLGNIAAKINGVEIHDYLYFPDSYPCVGFSDNQYYDIVWRANEGQMAPRIKDIRAVMDKHDPSGRIQIIEDEWGDWLMNWKSTDDWLQQGTVMDALSAASTLNVFMANADRITMAGLAQAINVIHSLFLTNASTGGKDLVKTPTFYVFKMLKPHHTDNAKWAPSTLASEKITGNGKTFSVLSSGATVNDAGQVNINLVNVDPTKTRDVTITLTSSTASYALTQAEVITGPAKDSFNDFGQTETVNIQPLANTSYQACGKKVKVTLPSKSVVMLTLGPQ
jgi:alpha-N-arabinofuranosidase